MASSEDRLPRVAHAERPRPDEKILWKTGADLNNGWLGRHGTLYLTEQRLVFVPTPLDHLLRAKRREIAREDIEAIEARRGTEVLERGDGALLALFTDRWQVQWVQRDHPEVMLEPLVAEVDTVAR